MQGVDIALLPIIFFSEVGRGENKYLENNKKEVSMGNMKVYLRKKYRLLSISRYVT